MILRTRYIFLLYGLCISPFSRANDSMVAFKNSELTYQTHENIEMQKEHLTITKEKVKVDYVFFNHGPEVTLDVAFPLPASAAFEAADGSYSDDSSWDPIFETLKRLDDISGSKDTGAPSPSPFMLPSSKHPFANFMHTEEGEQKPYEWKIIALDRTGKDITEVLKRHKIPLSANYLNGVMDTPGLELHPEFIDPLKKLGLLVREKADFQTQVIFYWKSTFPAHRPKRTSHTYYPQCGFFMFHIAKGGVLIPEDRTYANKKAPPKFLKLFWNEGPQRKLVQDWLNEAKKEKDPQRYSYLMVHRLRYILTTGKNWKHGRIKNFTLTVPIPKNTEVFIFGIDGLKKVGNTWKAELRNFSPQHELNIFYVRKES